MSLGLLIISYLFGWLKDEMMNIEELIRWNKGLSCIDQRDQTLSLK